VDDAELKKARFYALKSTNLKPRSIEELKEKLSKKGFTGAVITEVLVEFTKKGMLDDSKFSRLWVESRMYSNPKGEPVLRQEL
jgi:regulatory protein